MADRKGVYVHVDKATDQRLDMFARGLPPNRRKDGSTKKWSKGALVALAVNKFLDSLQTYVGEATGIDDMIEKLSEVDPYAVEITRGTEAGVSSESSGLKEFE